MLFFLPAYGRKVELPLLILDNVDYRLVQDHLTDLDFLSKERKQLHIHLKVLGANERFLSKSRIIGHGKLLETGTDATPQAHSDVPDCDVSPYSFFDLGKNVLLVAIDQTVETNKGDARNDNKNEQNDDATYDPFSHSVSSLGGFLLGLFPDCGETISLKLIGTQAIGKTRFSKLVAAQLACHFAHPTLTVSF